MATGLSRLTEGAVNRDQVTRLLACRQQTEADLWAKVKPLLRRIQSQQGILILMIPLLGWKMMAVKILQKEI